MTDNIAGLVERLRGIVYCNGETHALLLEAADALERMERREAILLEVAALRAENERLRYLQRKAWETAEIKRLREALEKIAGMAMGYTMAKVARAALTPESVEQKE